MIEVFIFLFVFFTTAAYSQVNRFIYEYTYAPDSLQPKVFKKDLMILDIGPKESVFMSYRKFRADSLSNANPQMFLNQVLTGGTNSGAAILGDFSYIVRKSYPDQKVYFYDKIGRDLYRVQDDKKMNWTITSEKQKIGDYDTQKATVSYGGRTWEAWFATSVPLQDGPYKFHGLPGLIVKIQDKTHTHKMVLVANKNNIVTEGRKSGNFRSYANEFQVNEQQFTKLWKESLNDPGKTMADLGSSSGKTVVINNGVKSEGNPMEMAGSVRNALKEREKRYSNKIEPGLYK